MADVLLLEHGELTEQHRNIAPGYDTLLLKKHGEQMSLAVVLLHEDMIH